LKPLLEQADGLRVQVLNAAQAVRTCPVIEDPRMTHAQALRQMITDLERPIHEPVAYFETFDGAEQHACAHAAARGDLDAAGRLHAALLPGWSWAVEPTDDGRYAAHVGGEHRCFADLPARAWLLAILHAKLAEAERQWP